MMRKSVVNCCLLLLVGASCVPNQGVKLDDLTVEMKSNPLGVSTDQPRFSWKLESGKNGLVQTAYEIQVAESEKDLKSGKNLLWSSGVVESDQSLLIPYDGPSLGSMKKYYWRVKLNTNQGETAWSKPQLWSTAMVPSDFKAKWIGEANATNEGEVIEGGITRLAARYLRKEFDLANKPIKDATLYISGLGSNVAFINGERITDDVFVPVVSDYNNTAYYNVYDVKDLLSKGKNTIGVTLGNGRYFSMIIPGFKSYGIPSLYSQLEVEYADGEKQTFVSDETWKVTSKGPIVANNEFMGEEYDANKEMPGWNKNGFDDSSWVAVDLMTVPAKRFLAQQNPPMRVQDEIKPVSIVRRSDGAYIIDMGQNMVGWLDVSLNGKKDSTISMRFAEILNPDTTLYLANLRRVRDNYDKYTPSKDGKFEWEPNFTYHGFRFVEVKGLDYEPSVKDFTGKVVYDKMKTTGSIETSNPLVNQIHKNAYWGIRGNYRGMPTDCPQRDERLGWLGDRATGCYGESYIFDNALLYEKWMQDIEDGMDEEGRIPSVAPTQWTILPGDITWPSAFFYAADMIRTKFGDERPIKKYYPAMRRFVEFVKNNTMENYIVLKDQYGDWCMPPESQELIHSKDPARKTAPEVLSTTVFYDLLNKMKGYAVIAGCPDDTTEYAELAANIKDAYNKKFFDPETGRYDNNTVTANILSLRLGLVPEGYEQKVVDNIVEKTNVDFGGHVSTGVLGIQHLMRGLTETGNLDLAYKILTNETYPSWGYMIKNGATTIWELWNGNTADPAMNSGNHVMLLGDLIVWYYENLAGIKNAQGSTAFKDIVISPVFPEGLDMVDASFDSPYGPIKSHWSKKDGKLKLDVTVPGNTSALVRLPEDLVSLDAIKAQLGTVEGVKDVTSDAGEVAVKIGSGTYHFE